MEWGNRITEIGKYIFYGKSRYYIHSPFVYKFTEDILKDDRHYYAFDDIDWLRGELLKKKTPIKVDDFGAGSDGTGAIQNNQRLISELTSKAGIKKKYGQFLFRLLNYYKPASMLELGTSLGLSTLYQSLANPNAPMTTIEGASEVAQIALQNMQILEANNVHIINGTFEQCLPDVLNEMTVLPYVFF